MSDYQPRRLRILPADNTALPIQDCERLQVRLSIAACGARWLRAGKAAGSPGRNPAMFVDGNQFISCVGCPVGEANQDWVEDRESVSESGRRR